MHNGQAIPLSSTPIARFRGRGHVPGDKSISHRALILGSVAIGETKITGLLQADDVLRTREAMRALGCHIKSGAKGDVLIRGVGLTGLRTPDQPLDFGNSGTGVRLTMGLIASSPLCAHLIGDPSLSRRPMARIIKPLEQMGARFEAKNSEFLPVLLYGTQDSIPISYTMPVASAQVKSAILLAALNVPGCTTIIETSATRNHTEQMLKAFGADIRIMHKDGANHISLFGHHELQAQNILIPADPSSAAFPLVGALITKESDIIIEKVMLNPTRIGLITTLQEMGADIILDNRHQSSGEEVGDIRARSSPLKGVLVPAQRSASMIDEYPILAVAAAFAKGVTRLEGLEELRIKESDRLAAIEAGLSANGVVTRSGPDWLEIEGGKVRGGGKVFTHMDHRIAMSFLILGLGAQQPVLVDDGRFIATSFPNFVELMNGFGASIS